MKKALDSKGIQYKSSSNKNDLLTIIRKHNLVRYCQQNF